MTLRVSHATTVVTPDSADGKVSSNAWNADHVLEGLFSFATRTEMVAGSIGDTATLTEEGRAGTFLWSGDDLSYQVGMDTAQAVYVAPVDAPTGVSGAWVRQYNGPLKIEWFGGVADWNGASGTDNLAAINAAIAFQPLPSLNFSPEVRLGLGDYYVSSTIEIETVCRLIGEGNGSDSASVTGTISTSIVSPTDTLTIRIHNSDTHLATTRAGDATKSAAGSHLEGFCVAHATQGTSADAHGIWMRAHATLVRLSYRNIAGDAIHNRAYSAGAGADRGNTNGWRVIDNFVYSCGGSGISTYGSDANTGYCIGFKTKFCGGCGIYDVGTLGNTYIAPDIEGYGTYGGTLAGVFHLGRKYQLIASIEYGETLGSTTTPGTASHIWHDIGALAAASTAFPQWVNGNPYGFHAPIHITGNANFGSVITPYIEAGATLGHVDGPAIVYGGEGGFTNRTARLSAGQGLTAPISSPRGIGTYRTTIAGTPEATKYGTYQYTYIGSGNPTDETNPPNILSHQRQIDADQPLYWGYTGTEPDLRIYYGDQRYMMWFANKGTAQQAGTGASKPYYLVLPDIIRYSDDGSATGRVEGLRNAVPSSGAHARGEFYRNYDPSTNGIFGWLCTTSGVPGTWQIVTAPTGSNSGDQTTIVGISGTLAQFNTACSDADFASGGGTATGTNTGDETSGTVVSKLAGQALAPASVAATGALSAGTTVTATGKVIGTAGLQSNNGVIYRADGSAWLAANTSSISDYFAPGSGDHRFWNSASNVVNHEIGNDGSVYVIGTKVIDGATHFLVAAGIPAFTGGDVTSAGGSLALTIAADAVTNTKLANMAAHTFKGNNTGSTADPLDLSATQLTAELNAATTSLQGAMSAQDKARLDANLTFYRTLIDSSGYLTAADAAATYGLPQGQKAAVSGTGILYPINTIYIRAADYPAIGTLSPKVRVEVEIYCNDVAPGVTFTVALHPITRPATSGGAGLCIYTIGAAVASSGIAVATPAADSSNQAVTAADIALPADGHYVLAVTTSGGALAASSHVHISARLRLRYA